MKYFVTLSFLLVTTGAILALTSCNAPSNSNAANKPANTANTSNVASANSNAANTADESAALTQMEKDWNDAYVKRDEAWFEKNLASDYSEIGDSGKTQVDKAGSIAAMKADKSTDIIAELSETKVRIDGNAAVVTGVNHVKLKDEKGHAQDYKHRYTDTYIKRDGHWQVWANQSTRIPQ